VVAARPDLEKAQATAAGFVGLFGYVAVGRSGIGLGWVAQNYGWTP